MLGPTVRRERRWFVHPLASTGAFVDAIILLAMGGTDSRGLKLR
ncbi:hypothetical protein [Cellulomonas sp. Leaf334]|nr:hypothetical protein [Cellulomonas sp. Leaf334]